MGTNGCGQHRDKVANSYIDKKCRDASGSWSGWNKSNGGFLVNSKRIYGFHEKVTIAHRCGNKLCCEQWDLLIAHGKSKNPNLEHVHLRLIICYCDNNYRRTVTVSELFINNLIMNIKRNHLDDIRNYLFTNYNVIDPHNLL